MGAAAGKRAKKEEDYVDRLEKEIRELKSINRSLMKQLKKLSKGIHKEEYEEALEEVNTTRGKKKEDNRERECPSCSREGLKEIIIAGRLFYRCSICDYKSGVIKK